jgi:hypothetical protein
MLKIIGIKNIIKIVKKFMLTKFYSISKTQSFALKGEYPYLSVDIEVEISSSTDLIPYALGAPDFYKASDSINSPVFSSTYLTGMNF